MRLDVLDALRHVALPFCLPFLRTLPLSLSPFPSPCRSIALSVLATLPPPPPWQATAAVRDINQLAPTKLSWLGIPTDPQRSDMSAMGGRDGGTPGNAPQPSSSLGAVGAVGALGLSALKFCPRVFGSVLLIFICCSSAKVGRLQSQLSDGQFRLWAQRWKAGTKFKWGGGRAVEAAART